MSQSTQSPEWGSPPAPQPPKQKRQFLVTKIAIGVAAGIALFLIGLVMLVGVLIGGSSTGDKQATAAAPITTQFTPPDSTPTDTAPAAQPPEVGKVGDTVTATGDDGAAADITITKIATRYAALDYQTAEHGMFLIVYVKVSGTAQSFDINPLDFYVTGADGSHYEDPTYASTGDTPALDSGTLHAGEHMRGVLVYDVNPKAKHGKFAYSPNLDGEPIATWSY